MSKDEMRQIVAEHLARYRTWSYAQLAAQAERRSADCLEHIEGTAPDGTDYHIELNVFWNDRSRGELIVFADLSAEPQRPLWGFIPIYSSDATESFIMGRDGPIVAAHGIRTT